MLRCLAILVHAIRSLVIVSGRITADRADGTAVEWQVTPPLLPLPQPRPQSLAHAPASAFGHAV